jgi:hypothetical protein
MIVINLKKSWSNGMTQEELYEVGRKYWILNYARTRREKYILFVADNIVRGVMKINRVLKSNEVPGRVEFEGVMLQDGDPIFDEYNNQPSPIRSFRNPVNYLNFDEHLCACGCGKKTDREFLPGHDQRAIHERISRNFDSISEFLVWFDKQFPV